MLNGFSDEQIVSMLGSHTLWSKRACHEILRRKDDFIPRRPGGPAGKTCGACALPAAPQW
jgi:hypothetical protein